MPHKTIIRLSGVARNPANGFPARLLGLQLVNTLTKQLGGTIELDRRGGTAFTLKIPASPNNGGDQRNG